MDTLAHIHLANANPPILSLDFEESPPVGVEDSAADVQTTTTEEQDISDSAPVWERLKEELRRLYIDEGRTTEAIRIHMGKKGFNASVKMFKSRFRRWGFTKNIGRVCLASMVRVQLRRAILGRPAIFDLNGKQIDLAARLQTRGMTAYDVEQTETHVLPGSVRARTPPEFYDSPGSQGSQDALSLKDSLLACAKILPFGGGKSPTQESGWIEIAWSLGLGFALFSRGYADLGNAKCGSAFDVLHLLVQTPCLDSLMYFLFIPLVWPDYGVTRELCKYLAACPYDNTPSSLSVHKLFQTMIRHIDAYGTEKFLDNMEACISDLLVHLHELGHLVSKSDVMEWSQDMTLSALLDGYISPRAFSIAARCLPLVGSSEGTDPIWQVMEKLYTMINEKGVAHSDVLGIANELLLTSQGNYPQRDHAYCEFHALTALAAVHKKRWEREEIGHHLGLSLIGPYLKSAHPAAKSTTCLAPAVRLENWFVVETWSRKVGDLDTAERARNQWEEWVRDLELTGKAPRL